MKSGAAVRDGAIRLNVAHTVGAQKGVAVMSIGNQAMIALISERLASDSRLAALAIDVCCADGFVLLVGSVDTIEQKKLAVNLVTGLIGVRNVKDELVMRGLAPAATAPAGGERAAM